MKKWPSYLKYLENLSLTRLGGPEEAGLWITSLPWPRSTKPDLALDSQATYIKPLGQWPGQPPGTPRRLLMIADGGNHAPEQLSLHKPGRKRRAAAVVSRPTAQ